MLKNSPTVFEATTFNDFIKYFLHLHVIHNTFIISASNFGMKKKSEMDTANIGKENK